MKKVLAVLVSLALFVAVSVAYAADEPKPAQPQGMPMMDHQMMMKGGGGMGMMDCPMMKGDGGKGQMGGMMKGGMMQHHQMMMHDMMQTMKDMMAIQKKMLSTVTPEEKAKMETDLSGMMEKMDKMMSSCKCMMMDMQKPAPGETKEPKKEEPMPMEHKH